MKILLVRLQFIPVNLPARRRTQDQRLTHVHNITATFIETVNLSTNFSQPYIQPVHSSSLTFRISRICCHSNETRALIANPLLNSAQLGGIPYHFIQLHPVRAVVQERGKGQDRQTYTQTAVITIHFAWL